MLELRFHHWQGSYFPRTFDDAIPNQLTRFRAILKAMPTHQGIKLSLVSQWELKVLPEFPHPDSSQFTYRSPDLRAVDHTDRGTWTPSLSSDSKADRLLGRRTAVSVYTPSLPGIFNFNCFSFPIFSDALARSTVLDQVHHHGASSRALPVVLFQALHERQAYYIMGDELANKTQRQSYERAV